MDGIFEKAVAFAFKAHSGQKRRAGGMYVLHALEAATIVGTMTNDEEVLAAAVLHDTVEDTAVTAEEIKANFGERVAELVAHETENKRTGLDSKATWKIRKEESLNMLKESDIESKMLWLGDKLSNMRSIASDHERIGESVFEKFNQQDPKEQCWYYGTVLEYIKELSKYQAYKEYEFLFHKVFKAYE